MPTPVFSGVRSATWRLQFDQRRHHGESKPANFSPGIPTLYSINLLIFDAQLFNSTTIQPSFWSINFVILQHAPIFVWRSGAPNMYKKLLGWKFIKSWTYSIQDLKLELTWRLREKKNWFCFVSTVLKDWAKLDSGWRRRTLLFSCLRVFNR
jgi:hypothetical protein